MVKMLNNMWKIKSIVKADGKNWPGRKENATASSAEGWEEEADWGGAQLQSQGVLFAYFEVLRLFLKNMKFKYFSRHRGAAWGLVPELSRSRAHLLGYLSFYVFTFMLTLFVVHTGNVWPTRLLSESLPDFTPEKII